MLACSFKRAINVDDADGMNYVGCPRVARRGYGHAACRIGRGGELPMAGSKLAVTPRNTTGPAAACRMLVNRMLM